MVINLISNAVKFTDAGSITCSARREDGEMVVSVADSGIGIAPADQPKVFEKFKQVGDTLTDKPKGTGLGLPICKEIVEYHGGHIWVESDAGPGQHILLHSSRSPSIPRKLDSCHDAAVDIESLVRQLREKVATHQPRDKSVLVVDDDAQHPLSSATGTHRGRLSRAPRRRRPQGARPHPRRDARASSFSMS